MVYEWKVKGVNKVDAQIAGEVCAELTNTVGLTTKTLLDASRPEDAPLHNEFEWVDSVAAEKYRETQASRIIRNIAVVTEETEPVKAYVTLETKIGERSYYEPTLEVIQEKDKREKLLDKAKWELNVFKHKYATLTELADVFRAIDKLNG